MRREAFVARIEAKPAEAAVPPPKRPRKPSAAKMSLVERIKAQQAVEAAAAAGSAAPALVAEPASDPQPKTRPTGMAAEGAEAFAARVAAEEEDDDADLCTDAPALGSSRSTATCLATPPRLPSDALDASLGAGASSSTDLATPTVAPPLHGGRQQSPPLMQSPGSLVPGASSGPPDDDLVARKLQRARSAKATRAQSVVMADAEVGTVTPGEAPAIWVPLCGPQARQREASTTPARGDVVGAADVMLVDATHDPTSLRIAIPPESPRQRDAPSDAPSDDASGF